MVKFLVEKGASLKAVDKDGATPILYATKYEKLDIIKYLISIGCSAKEFDNSGATCLLIASVQGNYEITEYFLENNLSSMDECDKHGFTPLLSAFSVKSNLKLINYLMAKGGSLLELSKENINAFSLAAASSDITILEWLSTREEINIYHKSNKGNSALFYAANHDRCDVVRWLLNHFEFDIHEIENHFTLLLQCALKGSTSMMETLLDLGANINDQAEGFLAIHVATFGNILPMIEWLLNHGFIIDEPERKNGKTPLCIASSIKTIDFLIEHGATITLPNSYSIIHEISSFGNFNILKYLVEVIGVDINALDQYSYCPLFFAAESGHFEIVKYLIKKGAYFDGIEYSGKNFLHVCCVGNCLPLMEYVFFDEIFKK